MGSAASNSVFILKLIGWLFSLCAFALLGLTLWMFIDSFNRVPNSEYTGLMISSAILTAATATIAMFIWWIVSNRKRFINYE